MRTVASHLVKNSVVIERHADCLKPKDKPPRRTLCYDALGRTCLLQEMCNVIAHVCSGGRWENAWLVMVETL